MAMAVLAADGIMLAADDTAKNLQESYHVWTPEPELATAIACQDNDFGCEHPDDPNKHKQVPLPTSVRDVICRLTRKTFESESYEGPTKYTDLFGYIYRIIVPDSNNLHLYLYQLKPMPTLSFRYYTIVLILHDVANDTISSSPVLLRTDFQSYCFRPWIRFEDVLGDSKDEVLLLTGEHNGNVYNCMHQHIIQIESGPNLHKLGTIKTGIWFSFMIFDEMTGKRNEGYMLRTISKVDNNHFTSIVSCSENKQMQGEIIFGSEVYELQEKEGLIRIAVELEGKDEDEITTHNNKIIMDPWFF